MCIYTEKFSIYEWNRSIYSGSFSSYWWEVICQGRWTGAVFVGSSFMRIKTMKEHTPDLNANRLLHFLYLNIYIFPNLQNLQLCFLKKSFWILHLSPCNVIYFFTMLISWIFRIHFFQHWFMLCSTLRWVDKRAYCAFILYRVRVWNYLNVYFYLFPNTCSYS